MDTAEFTRLHHIRAPNLMWFLGAGASAASGIPTAWDMIWDFKRRIYCTAQRIPISACEDLSDPVLQQRLQGHFAGQAGCPPLGSEEEYAVFFKAMYPSEADRRRYIEQQTRGARPSHGHHGLAALMKLGKVSVLWTTNFDRVIEDAASAALGGTGQLVVSDLQRSSLARQAMNEGSWPVLIKLHGDFQSRDLKNTLDELSAQHEELRRAFLHAAGRFGLAVVGYSGRDASIMQLMEDALEVDGAFPTGLYWFVRSGSRPLARVERLVEAAKTRGIEAALIPIETFDELIADVLLLEGDVPAEVFRGLDPRGGRLSEVPLPGPGAGYPVMRLNALPIVAIPGTCRLVKCGIGGAAAVRAAVEESGGKIIAGRRSAGVLVFGEDSEVRRAFSTSGIERLDLTPFSVQRLQYDDSVESGMALEALCRGVARIRPVRFERRRGRPGRYILIAEDPARPLGAPEIDYSSALRQTARALSGKIPGINLTWAEAVQLRLERRQDRLWLLLIPMIWVERTEDQEMREKAGEFVRERMAGRRNKDMNQVLDGWVELICGQESEVQLSAFGVKEGEGVDARFTVSRVSARSWRLRPVLSGSGPEPSTDTTDLREVAHG